MKLHQTVVRTWPIFGVLTWLSVTGCGGGPDTPSPEELPPIARPDRLYRDAVSGVRESVRVVIQDQAALEDLWLRATSEQLETPALPQIDFEREMVLVAGAGRMTTEDGIEITGAGVRRRQTQQGEEEDVLIVQVRTVRGCGRVTADAYPVDIVRVSRFDDRVQWEEETDQVTDCGPPDPWT